MKTLKEYRLFSYLASCIDRDEPVPAEEISASYEEYKQMLFDLSGQQISLSEKLRYLLYAKVELIAFRKQYSAAYCRRIPATGYYLDKCLLLIEAEIELVNFSVQHPEANAVSPSYFSSLHWKGTLVNLMELISSLDYSELITDENGKRISFAGIVSAFEKLFNVSIPKPYDLRADLSRRKKHYSILLPKLKEAFEKNIINCGNGK